LRKLAILFATLAFSGSAAAAQPASMTYDWSGFYAGLNFGYGWANRSVDFTANDPVSSGLFAQGGQPPSTSFNASNPIGGFQLGYNWQFNTNWLAGVETDFDWSDMNGSGVKTAPANVGPGLIIPFVSTVGEQIDWFGTVRARLGYLPTSNLMAYVTGGFAYGRVARTGSYFNNSGTGISATGGAFEYNCGGFSNCFTGSSSGVDTGWTLGGGFDYAVSTNVSFRVEYLYVNLSGKSFADTASPSPGLIPSSFNANFNHANFNVARVGVNLRL
jgi:outer membrane immunogenic protein